MRNFRFFFSIFEIQKFFAHSKRLKIKYWVPNIFISEIS